jgi:hypothetical protein
VRLKVVKFLRPLLGGALAGAVLVGAGVVSFDHGSAATHRLLPIPISAAVSGGPASSASPLSPGAGSSSGTSSAPEANEPAPDPEVAIQAQQAAQAVVPSAHVGVEVLDRANGTVLTSQNANQQFPTMSVVKLLIALDILHKNHWALPDPATQQLVSRMLSFSDDQIASTLWVDYGGSSIVTTMAGVMGLSHTDPPSDPGEWGNTMTTPQDLAKTYQYVTEQLPPTDRTFILNALFNAAQIAADGTNQYFGIPDALPHSTWWIKQGWGTDADDAEINTTGMVGTNEHYVVIFLSSAPIGTYKTLPAAVTAGTKVLSKLAH